MELKRSGDGDRGDGEVECQAWSANATRLAGSLAERNASATRKICYGALDDGVALTLRKATSKYELPMSSDPAFYSFSIKAKDKIFFLENGDLSEFAILDVNTTAKLTTLNDVPLLHFEALTERGSFSKRQRNDDKRNDSKTFQVSINLFGPEEASSLVAVRLAKISAYLQHPMVLPRGVDYCNPQYFRLPGEDPNMNKFVTARNDPLLEREVEISAEIHRILDSISVVAGDEDFVAPAGLVSQLKRHQSDGVRFILQRETELVSKRLENDLQAVVPTSNLNESQSRQYGGLIADVMGLGKTLTMLTAILHSLPGAEMQVNFSPDVPSLSENNMLNSKATLVIAPSVQLMENWISDIKRHFTRNLFKHVVFHGRLRPRDQKSLALADLVFTTFATIVADQEGLGTLTNVNWFRVVLDEAHCIKNSGSKQFRAVSNLSTRRRWCLTGTPIQNRLDELASLAGFLRLSPFESKQEFQRHILAPLSKSGDDATKPFRAYLQAFCLRRAEDHLNLPNCRQEVKLLQFSIQEQMLYRSIMNQTKYDIDDLVSKGSTIRRYNVLFTALLRMRMFCNHGRLTEAKSEYLTPAKQVSGCERCSTISEDDAILLESVPFCPDCSRSLYGGSPNSERSLSPNYDLCGNSESPLGDVSADTPCSTKLTSVAETIKNHDSDSKHIVFSYWTSTLDILGNIFNQSGIRHVHVDGRTNYTERSRLLDAFREDSDITVLLMSIESGAVGLNLTVANVVHIIEPQWNPSIEEQAVARALRMGQLREVVVFRYIMQDTVEENVSRLQEKKKRLARFAFGQGNSSSLEDKLEDLKFALIS